MSARKRAERAAAHRKWQAESLRAELRSMLNELQDWLHTHRGTEVAEAIQDSIMRANGAVVTAMPPMTDEECWAEAARLSGGGS